MGAVDDKTGHITSRIRDGIVSALRCTAEAAGLPALRKLAAEEGKDKRVQDWARKAVEEIETREAGE